MKCQFECKSEEKIARLEKELAEFRAEINVYIKGLHDNIKDIKGTIDDLRIKQRPDAEIKEIVRETVKNIEDTRNRTGKTQMVLTEILRVVGTALAIIGGLQMFK